MNDANGWDWPAGHSRHAVAAKAAGAGSGEREGPSCGSPPRPAPSPMGCPLRAAASIAQDALRCSQAIQAIAHTLRRWLHLAAGLSTADLRLAVDALAAQIAPALVGKVDSRTMRRKLRAVRRRGRRERRTLRQRVEQLTAQMATTASAPMRVLPLRCCCSTHPPPPLPLVVRLAATGCHLHNEAVLLLLQYRTSGLVWVITLEGPHPPPTSLLHVTRWLAWQTGFSDEMASMRSAFVGVSQAIRILQEQAIAARDAKVEEAVAAEPLESAFLKISTHPAVKGKEGAGGVRWNSSHDPMHSVKPRASPERAGKTKAAGKTTATTASAASSMSPATATAAAASATSPQRRLLLQRPVWGSCPRSGLTRH